MRLLFTFLSLFVCSFIFSQQQGVAINTDGSAPHSSAMLDVNSTSGGLLAPRMTSAQRIAISSPTAGLMVYDTDMKEFYHHDGGVWRKLLNSNYWQRSSSGNHVYSIGDSVGISTSTPDYRFHVNSGSIYLQDNRDGATLNPHLIFDIPAVDYKEGGLQWKRQGDTLASLDYFANPILSNYLKFTVGKGSSMYLNSSGLGLGSADPQAKLHIRQPDGDNVIRLDGVNPEIEFRKKSSSTITSWTPVGFLQTSDNDLRIGTYSSNTAGKFIIRTGGDDRVFVNNEGYVGIGTDIPAAKLQVHGGTGEQLRIFAAQNPILQFADGFAFNQVKKGFIQLAGDNLRIGTNSGNENGSFVVRTNGTDQLTIDGGGAAFFSGSVNAMNVNISGNTAIRNGGILSIAKSGGLRTVEIKPTENGSDGSSMLLYNSAGVVTIEMDADHGGDGDGRVITNELQINGGSDLAENFDINDDEEKNLKPGMLVSIDPEKEGLLCITKQANDKKIVGVISGANGIKPGMLMGQQGTIAYGKYPIALAGRVYVFCNDEGGEINAGDFLTSSSKPGYAKKAGNLINAQGAIIGKAMGKADTKTGFVLVLINLQ